jgi:general L-amino acid transport system permease protein
MNARQRALLWQALAGGAVIALALWLWGNLSANLATRALPLDFGFVAGRASFEMGDNLLGYRAGDSFLHAFAAGLANTLLVALLGMVLAFALGLAVAFTRLARNPLLARAAWLYVEVARNTPLLLQLLFWHQLIVRLLPGPRQAIVLPAGLFLSNRGLAFPTAEPQAAFLWAALIGLAASALVPRRRVLSGGAAALLAGWLLAAPVAWDAPVLRGFNFRGGGTLSVEFIALLWSLVFYQGAFAAETLRGAILGVPRGTIEAAVAQGLRARHVARFVVLPQAFRSAVPPLASQAMSLTKNSSLAVAIGYPDLVRVATVTISETGRAVECIMLILAVYLTLSLATAALMNAWNALLVRRGA